MKKNNQTWAIVDTLGAHGGLHYYTHNQANALSRLCSGVYVYMTCAPSRSDSYKLIRAFKNVYGPGPALLRAIKLWIGICIVAFDLRRRRIDCSIYHVFKGDVFEFTFFLLMNLMKMNTIAIVHDVERLDAPARLDLMTLILKLASRIMVHNDASLSALRKKALIQARKAFLCFHGNYVSDYPLPPPRELARRELGLPANGIILLFFGNPRPEKGLRFLIQALARPGLEKITLLIAGRMKSPMARDISSMINDLGLNERVIVNSQRISDEKLPVYFSSSNIVILPYTRVYESGVALMAMSLSRPPLASNLDAFKATITAGQNGFIFTSGDEESLRRELLDLIDLGVDELDRVGIRANDWVKKNRSWEEAAEILVRSVNFD